MTAGKIGAEHAVLALSLASGAVAITYEVALSDESELASKGGVALSIRPQVDATPPRRRSDCA